MPAQQGARTRRNTSGAEIGPAGFADDTNIYVRSPDAMEPLFQLLSNFEEASGLGVNRNKCVAIALHETERPSVDLGLPLAGPSDMNKLLGGQVSSEPNTAKTWEITIQQMRTRMRSAELKTTNVLQRIKLTKAILIPKFTFIARHHWPTSDQIARMQRLAHCVERITRRRHDQARMDEPNSRSSPDGRRRT
jgi:hypothetical protein